MRFRPGITIPVGLVSVLTVATLASSPEGSYWTTLDEYRPLRDVDGDFQFPYAADPCVYTYEHPDGQKYQNQAMYLACGLFAGKNLVQSSLKDANETPAITSPEEMTANATALEAVKKGGPEECPQDPEFITVLSTDAIKDDPTFTVCLKTDTAYMSPDGAVVFGIKVNSAFEATHIVDFPAMLRDATPEQCDIITDPMQEFASSLLEISGASKGVNTEIMIEPTSSAPCNTFMNPSMSTNASERQ